MIRITPESFNGFLFQMKNRIRSDFDTPYDWDIRGISTNNASRNQNYPKYSGKVYGGDTKVIRVYLNDVEHDKNDMVAAMDISGSEQHRLYGLDEKGQRWYCDAVFTSLNMETTEDNKVYFSLVFDVDDPTWTQENESSVTWSITADGNTKAITVTGDQPSHPKIEITATTGAVNYFPFKQYVKNYNPINLAQTDAVDITNGGWDTATIIAAGDMLPNGDDLLVKCDGAYIPRWFGGGGIDDASTKIFVRVAWKPGQSMKLRTAVAGAGTPAKLAFVKTAEVKAALGKLPISGMLRIQNEEFSYNGISVPNCEVNVVERTIRGTSIASHAAGQLAYWVEHDIQIIYGNALATTPVQNNKFEPVFEKDDSSTATRVYDAAFADTAGVRAGAWKRTPTNIGFGRLCRVYSGANGDPEVINPAEVMGMEIAAYQDAGGWKPDTGDLSWVLYHPAGIETVAAAGDKYKALANSLWPARAGLECSANGKVWGASLWNEAIPASAATPTAWSHLVVSCPAGTKYVRFRHQGSVNGVANNLTRFEVNEATVTLTSANTIQTGLNGVIAGRHLSISFTNPETGDVLYVEYPVTQGNTMTIDCDLMSATYRGMDAIRAIDWNTIRTEWFDLVRGTQTILYNTEFDTGPLTVRFLWHNRSR